jgi:ABC-2 type transport system ATP-binding protein
MTDNDHDHAIVVRDLRMRYGTLDVLTGVNFEIRPSEILVLLGPNGAGKTTIIEILEGFRLRSDGDVRVLGLDPAAAPEAWRARIGVVLQSWRDHGKWRVGELLEHLGNYYSPYSSNSRKRPIKVDELVEMVDLGPYRNQKIATLSGGQRRRMDVAIGIVGRPELLFLDEPTAGFDPEARRDFHDLIRRLSGLEGTTILLTTHDLDEAEKLAQRILILAGGRIVANGTAEELAAQVTGQSEVRWRRNAERYVETTEDAVAFVRQLLVRDDGEITDLEVRRPSLEETYMAMVRQHEAGLVNDPAATTSFPGAT